jgi:hypothetical protein
MSQRPFLVITSIANDQHPILNQYADACRDQAIPFVLIGDVKSPATFQLNGCDFYSIQDQLALSHSLARELPVKHYARKNLGYLIAIQQGAEVILETDDDNIPYARFWDDRTLNVDAHLLHEQGWVNIYSYFSETNIWPRGYPLDQVLKEMPRDMQVSSVLCPIQQGLADDNPDVDAIYRMVLPLPVKFLERPSIALAQHSMCPFNSQNTTWFKAAFPLLYLPSYCSFRMTDIWRSFVAQRIAWTCGWSILFHPATVYQIRNEHNIMKDFEDEIPGYLNNSSIMNGLNALDLREGAENLYTNLVLCYEELVRQGVVDQKELALLDCWIQDLNALGI